MNKHLLLNLLSNDKILDSLEIIFFRQPNNDWIFDSRAFYHFSRNYFAFNSIDLLHSATITSTRGYSHIIIRQGLVDLYLSNKKM